MRHSKSAKVLAIVSLGMKISPKIGVEAGKFGKVWAVLPETV